MLYQGGKQKKGPHRLILYSFCLMTMVTLMKDCLNSRPNFERRALIRHNKSPGVSAHININV